MVKVPFKVAVCDGVKSLKPEFRVHNGAIIEPFEFARHRKGCMDSNGACSPIDGCTCTIMTPHMCCDPVQ